MPRSRYQRSLTPPGIRVTQRDIEVLMQVAEHRYLSSEHLQQLVFHPTSKSSGLKRLQLLWQNAYLDRTFLPVVVDGSARGLSGRPLYTLARKGALVVCERNRKSISSIPHTPAQNRTGFETLAHNLVVTDLVVAMKAACQRDGLGASVAYDSETVLRQRLHHWRGRGRSRVPALLPDGAVTITSPSGATLSFFIEVIRAGARGGNRLIESKLRRYVALHRNGSLRSIYGYKRIRAVLFLTTSTERANRQQALALKLSVGNGLLWFTGYGKKSVTDSAFVPKRVLDIEWVDGCGQRHTIRPSYS